LLLKWLVEGAYVDVPGRDLSAKDFVEILDILQQPLDVDGDGVDDEPSHIQRLEGYEWAKLQESEIYGSSALIRIKGSAEPGTTHYKVFKKDLHKAAKAAIRSVAAQLSADDTGNGYLADFSYDAPSCLDATYSMDPNIWPDEPCDSFAHWIASTAARLYRDDANQTLFTLQDIQTIYQLYRVKSGKDEITSEVDANEFIASALQVIVDIGDPSGEAKYIYDQTISIDPRQSQRADNMTGVMNRIDEDKLAGKKHIVPRVLNLGTKNIEDLQVRMYKDSSETEKEEVEIEAGGYTYMDTRKEPRPIPGDPLDLARKNVPVFEVKDLNQTNSSEAGWVSFLVDLPQKHFQEPNRDNNWAKAYYYVLDPSNPAVPTPADPPLPVSDPLGTMLDPDPVCEKSPKLKMIQLVDGAPEGTVYIGGPPKDIEVEITNLGGIRLENIEVFSSIAGPSGSVICTVASLDPGATTTCTFSYQPESEITFVQGFILATANDQYGDPVGLQIDASDVIMHTECPMGLVAPDPDPNPDVSEVMYEGTFYRYYRVMDRATGAPVAGETVRITFPSPAGMAPVVEEFTTDSDGHVVSVAGSGTSPPSLGVPWDSWMDGIINTTQPVEMELPNISCAEKVVFGFAPKSFAFSESIAAGAAVKLGGKLAGGKLSLGGERGIGLSLASQKNSSSTTSPKFNISRSKGASVGLSYDATLFEIGGSVGPASIDVGSSAEGGVGIALAIGDKYKFLNNPLTDPDKGKVFGLMLDTAVDVGIGTYAMDPVSKFFAQKIIKKLIDSRTDFSQNKETNSYKFSTSLSGAVSPFSIRGTWFTYGAEPGLQIGASVGAQLQYTYSIEDAILEQTRAVGHGLQGELSANFGVSGGYFDRIANYTDDHRRGIKGVNYVIDQVSGLTAKLGGGLSAGAELKTTSDSNNKPEKLELEIAGEKKFGMQLDPVTGQEVNIGAGDQFKRTYSISDMDEVKESEIFDKMLSIRTLLDSGYRTVLGLANETNYELGPTTILDFVTQFIHLTCEDAEYEDKKELGEGTMLPFGFKLSAGGTGIDNAAVEIRADHKISYTTEKGVMKGAESYKLEDYSGIALDLDTDGTIKPKIMSIIDQAAAGVASFLHTVTRAYDSIIGQGIIESFGSAKLTVYNREDYDAVVDLLSFDFEGITGPTKSYHYSASGVVGSAEKPHYGIGGFHSFETRPEEDGEENIQLTAPATLVLDYDDEEVAGIDESSLGIYFWNFDNGNWDYLGGDLDENNNTITIEITELGIFTIGPVMPSGKVEWLVMSTAYLDENTVRISLRTSQIQMNNGDPLPDGTIFHVISALPHSFETGDSGKMVPVPFGDIMANDIDELQEGIQISTTSGTLQLDVELPRQVETGVRIVAYSERGTAFGDQVMNYEK